jgi:hypothetical protein
LIEAEPPRAFSLVAVLVGDDERKVRDLYRDFKIVEAAQQAGIPTDQLVAKRFSVLTLAMRSPAILEFIGAPATWDVEPVVSPISDDKVANLRQLIFWLVGDKEHAPAVRDSRQVSSLAAIIESDAARDYLVKSNDLVTAYSLTSAPRQALADLLEKAIAALEAAAAKVGEFRTAPEIGRLIERCEAALERLRGDA